MIRNWTSLAYGIAAFCLVIGGIVAQALAGTVAPRSAVTIERDVVLLRDLFDGLTTNGDIEIEKAPRPGESIVFEAETLARLGARHNVAWVHADTDSQVTITRAGQTIESEVVEAVVHEAVADRLMSASFEIEIGGGWPSFVVAAEAEDAPALIDLKHDERSGRFTAILGATPNSPVSDQLKIVGRVVRTESVPMPVRAIAPGSRVTEADLEWRSVRIDRLPQDPVLSADAIVGKSPRRPLKPGQLVRAADLIDPIVVAKGAPVTVVYSTPGIQLTMLGRAVEDGAVGQTIRVLNPQSKLVAVGVVMNDGTVQVAQPLHVAGIAPLAMQGDEE